MAVWEQIIQRSGKGDNKFADNSMKHQGVPVLLIAMVQRQNNKPQHHTRQH
jgi:hypothetical protein